MQQTLLPPNGTIPYDQMLASLAEGRDTPHRLVYVVGQGKDIGQLRDLVAYYGAPQPKTVTAYKKAAKPVAERKRHIYSGNVPFTEFGTQRLLTLFTFNIIRFNGKQVIC
jgi:hypothetical protein